MNAMNAIYIPVVPDANEAVASVIDNPFNSFNNPISITDGLQSFAMPKSYEAKLKLAKEYRKIDIVQRLMRIRVDFGSKIQGYRYPNKTQRKFWEAAFSKVNMRRFIRNFLFDLNTLGVVCPLWEVDDGGPLFLTAYDPELVRTVSAFGQEAHYIQLDGRIKIFLDSLTAEQRQQVHIPSYIRSKLDGWSNEVLVPSDNMVRVCLNKMDYESNPDPPISSIFDSLSLRKLLIDTDFSTAYGIRNEITQVTEGDEKRPTSRSKLKELQSMFDKPGKSLLLFTNHTVNIKRHAPDPKMWAPEKFKAAEERIFQWGGIAKALINGEGGSYATSYISIKSLMQSVQTDREYVEEFFDAFCKQVALAAGLKAWPSIVWDNTTLREDKAWQNELDFLMKWGIYGPRDLCEVFNIDYNKQVSQRESDREQDQKFMIPHFESAQGLLATQFGLEGANTTKVGEPGRPQTDPRPKQTIEPRPST